MPTPVTIGSGASHSVRYVKETTAGTTPTTPKLKEILHTGCSLELSRDTLTSNSLRSDRQIPFIRTGTDKVSGGIDFELCGGMYDDFIEAALAGTWAANVLKAGTTKRSFTIERAFTDIGQYKINRGCYVNQMTLSVKPSAVVTGSFDIVGLGTTLAATPLDSAYAVAGDCDPFDSFTGSLFIDDTDVAIVTGIDLTLANTVEAKFPIFNRQAVAVGYGKSALTGTLSAFFTDATFISKFINDAKVKIAFTLTRGDYSYAFLIPCATLTNAGTSVQGEGEISLDLPWSASLDATLGTNIQITRTVPTVPGA